MPEIKSNAKFDKQEIIDQNSALIADDEKVNTEQELDRDLDEHLAKSQVDAFNNKADSSKQQSTPPSYNIIDLFRIAIVRRYAFIFFLVW